MNNNEIKYGFWVGLGVMLAVAVWGLLTALLGRVAARGR